MSTFYRALSILLLPVLLAYLTLSFAVPGFAGVAQETVQGYLTLQTEHRGLEVRVDGNRVGHTPVRELALAPGPHEVGVENPYRSNWFDRPWTAEVVVTAGDTAVVDVVFEKSYSVNSQPFGAAVHFEQELLGETPLFFSLAEDSTGTVRLSREGYVDTSFVIGDSKRRYFNIALVPEQPVTPPEVAADIAPEKQKRSKLPIYLAVGVSAAAGGLALYFRQKGNERYDQYLSTGDPQRMEAYLSDAKRFDRLAAISFGVFQVSFVFSFYALIKRANR